MLTNCLLGWIDPLALSALLQLKQRYLLFLLLEVLGWAQQAGCRLWLAAMVAMAVAVVGQEELVALNIVLIVFQKTYKIWPVCLVEVTTKNEIHLA